MFKTADGYINIATSGDAMWKRLCQLFDTPKLKDTPDFAHAAQRSANRDADNAEIEKLTQKNTSEEWIKLLNEAGVPCGPIYSIDQVFADAQVEHLGMKHPVDHPDLGITRFSVPRRAHDR